MFISLSLPRWNDLLGLYEFDITNEKGTSVVVYGNSLEDINNKKKEFIRENLQLAQEQLTKFD